MALIENVQRINVEDFDPEDREVAERIAVLYNFFAEQVTEAINGNLDFENLSRDLMTFEVTVDSSGSPLDNAKFSTDTGLVGMNVINASNLTNSSVYPTNQPFISWTSSGTGTYTIQNISGLPANNKFRLVMELVF